MSAPILGVSVMIRSRDRVLLVRRGRPPLAGLWAFPGGKVRLGERLAAAAMREVREETGVAVDDLRQIDLTEIIDGDTGHFVLVVFAATLATTPTPVAGDDAAEARWVSLDAARRLPLTADTARILAGQATG